MPKNPDGGPASPQDSPGAAAGNGTGERRAAGRTGAAPASASASEIRTGPAAASAAGPAAAPREAAPAPGDTPQGGGGRHIGERKKQFLIAPRQATTMGPMGFGPVGFGPLGFGPMGFGPLGFGPTGFSPMAMAGAAFAPLSLSSVEQALRTTSDIEIVDTVGPRNEVGMLGDGMGGAQGVLVARMSEQKAGALHQQGQGRLVVERDQHLGLMEPQLKPQYVTSVIPSSGPALTAVIKVLGKDGTPLAGAEVSLFGSMLPATAVSDGSGQVTLKLYGETVHTLSSLYVKPKSDYWSFYQRDPDISAEEVNTVTLRALSDWPSLTGFPQQKAVGWGQKAMRMDQLPATYRGQGIRVAIIDSGAATTHDGLNRIRAGFDIVNKKTNPDSWNEDSLGHGSHCAGVICATDLTFGVRGFAPEAEIHVCKLFPGGQVSQLIDALEYCIEKQIDVVNLSLGGAQPSEALEQQILRAKRAGVACIVAAGNSGGPVQYPASSPQVLAVAAVGKLDEFPPDSYHAQTLSQDVDANGYFSASFSCFGPQVGVCAPGVAITSTVPPNNYAAWDGTSMAAPHITGLAALVLAHHPDFQGAFKPRSAERVERLFQVIKASARRVSLGDSTKVGVGLPDAVAAVGLQGGLAAQASSAPFMGSGWGEQALGGTRGTMPGAIPAGMQGGIQPGMGGIMPSPGYGGQGLPFMQMQGFMPGGW